MGLKINECWAPVDTKKEVVWLGFAMRSKKGVKDRLKRLLKEDLSNVVIKKIRIEVVT